MDLEKFGYASVTDAINTAHENDIAHMLCVCIDLENFPAVHQIALDHEHVTASVGVHPIDQVDQEPTVEELVTLAAKDKVVAIGETGLDYFHCKGDLTWQHDRFRTHIRAAVETNKPLIIHTRDAREDTIRILKEEGAERVGGVLHCFTESLEMAQAGMELGFYVSFSGIVTFKNAVELQDVAREIPMDRILVETDAPYLTPVPFRGKANQPAYVRNTAEYLADLKEVSLEALAEATTKNFETLFGVDVTGSRSQAAG